MLALLLVLSAGDGFNRAARPFLEAHCLRCHGGAATQGDLDLSGADARALSRHPEDWDWLVERVELGEMPPSGEAQPEPEERDRFVAWVRGALGPSSVEPALLPEVPLRRLTMAEYSAAARDLFDVSIDAKGYLPEDAVGHGFDHVSAAQSLSDLDFQRYLEAAESVAERAFAADEPGPPRVRRFVPSDMVGGAPRGRAYWLFTRGVAGAKASLPRGGDYVIRARVWGQQAGEEDCAVRLTLGDRARGRVEEVSARSSAGSQVLEARLHVERGGDVLAGVEFRNDYYRAAKGDRRAQDRNLAIDWIEVTGPLGQGGRSPLWERYSAEISGAEDPREGLASAVSDLAALTWRTPTVEREDVQRLLALSREDEDPRARLQTALVGLLVSPRFLFKLERGVGQPDARGSRRLSGEEAATRLAGYLWQGVPDRALLGMARSGALDTREGVLAAAEGMLEDPRSEAFVRSFGEQWLQLRILATKRPDRRAFPGFSTQLLRSMAEETARVLLRSLRMGRSLWDLVDGSVTVADARLMKLYGLERGDRLESLGGGWHVVDLSRTERRGLLGHASVLFATSESTRSSPVRRGKWVLDVLLGSAPPPPPPGVDGLEQAAAGEQGLTFRERFARHRADPNCAACHDRMDPLGFGLEAYTAIGALRAPQDPLRLDARGELPDGRTFNGPEELAAVLRADDRFLEAFVERMAVFGLGRALGRVDRSMVAGIIGELDPGRPTMERVILGVVGSDEFQRVSAGPRNGPLEEQDD
ncbi:MAG: DUF1588 domain-containing protein [Planctomycetota bacterium]|nr:DUF1588 domain-containing protein [Planctomycetota bacterium]MDG1982996.1 DUF1588 domain-containing protein [Planctomycetota bacterium]